jgi:hypothetical protein
MRSDVLLRGVNLVRVQLGALSQTQRFAATQTSTPARTPADRAKYQEQVNDYHRERAAWKRQMTELRKQWMQEHSEKVAAEQAEAQREEARRKERIGSALAASDAADGRSPQLQRLQQQVRDAELAHEVAVEKLKRAERASMRQQILTQLEAERWEPSQAPCGTLASPLGPLCVFRIVPCIGHPGNPPPACSQTALEGACHVYSTRHASFVVASFQRYHPPGAATQCWKGLTAPNGLAEAKLCTMCIHGIPTPGQLPMVWLVGM